AQLELSGGQLRRGGRGLRCPVLDVRGRPVADCARWPCPSCDACVAETAAVSFGLSSPQAAKPRPMAIVAIAAATGLVLRLPARRALPRQGAEDDVPDRGGDAETIAVVLEVMPHVLLA